MSAIFKILPSQSLITWLTLPTQTAVGRSSGYMLKPSPEGTRHIRDHLVSAMSLEPLFTNRYRPVVEILVDLLDVRDTIALSSTNRRIRNGGLSECFFNINLHLRPLFLGVQVVAAARKDDGRVDLFRRLQAQHRVMIIEQFACSFLIREPHPMLDEGGY
jgi:hypothetical protein